jgi:uncharacterized protein YdhG (YjbR/CyaY superfamily)
VSAIDDYLATLSEPERAALEHVREVVSREVPDAEESKSYGMPAFRSAGRPLIGFRAARGHLSVFPFSPEAIEAVKERLAGFDLSKGTIRFTPDQPIPDDVLVDLVRARVGEIA